MRYVLLSVMMLISSNVFPHNNEGDKKTDWNSYTQLRFATNFDDYNNFALRRLKFWIKSGPGFSQHWSFKAQALFSSYSKEKFFLQDVLGQYNFGSSSIRFGQFIPQYSLQRFQPDYLISATERARAVNLLIPDGTLGVRDLGVQYNLKTDSGRLNFNVGLFNGYGIKDYRFDNSGIMATQNLSYRITFRKSFLRLGYSVMYRKGEDLFLPGIVPDTMRYTGNEFGFDVNALFKSKVFKIQAEYLQANLETASANGYYALAEVMINPKNRAYVMYDNYTYGYHTAANSPWYFAGINHFFKSYDIMLTLETGFQDRAGELTNRTVVEFQMFFK